MRDPGAVQAELDAAQVDLESRVGQLKELVERKLETPKHIVEAIRKPLEFVRAHATLAVVAVIIGVAVLGLRRRR